VTGQGAWHTHKLGLDKLSQGLGEKKRGNADKSNEISLYPTMSNYAMS